MKRMLTDRIDLFCQHRWRVMKLADDAEWPLTDNPVLALNYRKPGEYESYLHGHSALSRASSRRYGQRLFIGSL